MEPERKPGHERLDLFSAREAADYLRVSFSTLYRMEKLGVLTPLRTPGRHRRYTLAMLNAVLADRTEKVEDEPA